MSECCMNVEFHPAGGNMLGNTLTALELLRNKGIKFETWEKWDKTAEMLPCKSQKQYQPNNSWLQNKQIAKGLTDRKGILGIERVERSSQLAAAEWLPQKSRARVTKKSGQEWTSFGLEENLELYLIPEEALLLLELNCLDLTWEGVALSIQQAYSVLLGSDQPECSIDEYRVYSHLVRQGYRLQRFRFGDGITPHDRNRRTWRSSPAKRKTLTNDPLNGFGITRKRIRIAGSDELVMDNYSTITTGVPDEPEPGHRAAIHPKSDRIAYSKTTAQLNKCEPSDQCDRDEANGSKMTPSTSFGVDRSGDGMVRMPEDCSYNGEHGPNVGNEEKIAVCKLDMRAQPLKDSDEHTDNVGCVKKLPSELYDNGVINLPGPSNIETKNIGKNTRNDSKLQIISDEMLSGDFRIISNWPGTRIQRNVKWMPRRDTGGTLPSIEETMKNGSDRIAYAIGEGARPVGGTRSRFAASPNSSEMAMDGDSSKGRKREGTHEVIEVSDDEIEEVPLKMSRMELLDLFPNIMSDRFVTKQIARRYLPYNVWPQKISNKYTKWQAVKKGNQENRDVHEIPRVGGGVQQSEASSRSTRDPPSSLGRRTPYQRHWDQDTLWAAESNEGLFRKPERLCVQLGVDTSVAVAKNIWGTSQFFRRGFLHHRHNPWTNMGYYHSKRNIINSMPRSVGDRALTGNSARDLLNMTCQSPLNNPKRLWDTSRHSRNHDNRFYSRTKTCESSFEIVLGARSWTETKAKWLDDKTITIEDKDCVDNEGTVVDESEVEVVARPVKPLVGRHNATTLAQVYKNLQFIKPATSKDFRTSRKMERTDYYGISYNLYTSGQQYKKATPGNPAYRIVVFRCEDIPFIELTDIVRLERDANGTPIVMACVSQTSITFAEIGIAKISNIQDDVSFPSPISFNPSTSYSAL